MAVLLKRSFAENVQLLEQYCRLVLRLLERPFLRAT